MELSLPAKFRKLIDDRVRSGKYASAEDVVKAALTTLDDNDRFGDFAAGELDGLIDEGERSLKRDGPMPAAEVFREIRRRAALLNSSHGRHPEEVLPTKDLASSKLP